MSDTQGATLGSAANTPVRGALRVIVGTSSPILEAGRPFSILVTIQNPFDVPVEISTVTTVVPVEFIDLERQNFERQREKAIERAESISHSMLSNVSPDKGSRAIKNALLGVSAALVSSFVPFGRFFEAAYKASQVIIASNAASPVAKIESAVDIDRIKEEINRIAASGEDDKVAAFGRAIDVVKREIENIEKARSFSSVLNPGNSLVQLFTLRTARSLLFPPSSYEVPIQISYKIGDVIHQDSTKYQLSIRSPLSAVIFGSIVGSIAGFLLKDVFEDRVIVDVLGHGGGASLLVWLIALLGNIILAIVTVVAFARKRETQPFISIEDFWGGLFIGAVAGYTGKTMLHGLITPPHS